MDFAGCIECLLSRKDAHNGDKREDAQDGVLHPNSVFHRTSNILLYLQF